jgi:hypothetical protein
MTTPYWYYILVNQSIIVLTHNDFAFEWPLSRGDWHILFTVYLSNPVAIIKFFMFNWLSMLSMLTWLCSCTGVLPWVVTPYCWNLPMNDLLLISLTKTRTSHDFSWSIDYSARFSIRNTSMNNSHIWRQFTQYIKTCNTKNTNVTNQTVQNNMFETKLQTNFLNT